MQTKYHVTKEEWMVPILFAIFVCSLILLGWGLTAVSAQNTQGATNAAYYVCECATDADGNCVTGNDSNNGTSPNTPWQTFDKARLEFGSINAGDAILFCQGGAFNASTTTNARWVNYNCQANNRCTVGDYTPPWASGDEARPILWRTNGHGFALDDGGNAEQEEGYTFQNLDLRCQDCAGHGFLIFNDIDHVLIDNVRMDGFIIGVHAANSNDCSGVDPDCDGMNSWLTIRNATIINNEHQGFLGGSFGLLLENSYFENNGSGTVFDHNIYLNNDDNMTIRGNELYRSSINADNRCGGVPLVGHGVMNNLTIENNYIREDIGFAEQGCWGIAIDAGYIDSAEQFTNLVIRNNRIENVGNTGIGVSSCINCIIENNVIIHEQSFGATGIAVPDRDPGPGDAETTAVFVNNNSIHIASSGRGIRVRDEGQGHLITSNAIQYTGSNAGWDCIQATLPAANYIDIDHNICGFTAGSWADGYATLTAWQATGFGGNSQATSPGFTSNSDLSPSGETAAIVDAGHPSLSSFTDITGAFRDAQPDVGAYEWNGYIPIYDEFIYLPAVVTSE